MFMGKNKVKQSKLCPKVLCLTKEKGFNFVFPNYCILKVFRAFQVSRGHFQCFWENKVKLCFKALFKVKQRQSDIPIWQSNFSRSVCHPSLFMNNWIEAEYGKLLNYSLVKETIRSISFVLFPKSKKTLCFYNSIKNIDCSK